jgi:hypothetical protein
MWRIYHLGGIIMLNNGLLNPENFEIDEDCCEEVEACIEACNRLIEKWTPELEN